MDTTRTIRQLKLNGAPGDMGGAHGAAYADDIRRYTADRIDLVMSGLWSGNRLSRADVIDIAESCVVHHQEFSPDLTEEMESIGRAAGLTLAEMVIVGGFTDFVDVVRASTGGPMPPEVIEDDCTAFIVPDHRAGGAGFFGQTWDMHDTATEFVILTDIRRTGAPRAMVFTTTGCVGQIGMNELGVTVGINNLIGATGRPGVTWPHVVRRALEEESADAAKDVVLSARLAGAHNFLIFDAAGVGYSIEAMPTTSATEVLARDVVVHTNHTLDPVTSAVEVPRPPALQASSEARLARARELLETGDVSEADLMAVTRDEQAICQIAVDPYRVESCGAAIMRPRTLDFWAVWGLPKDNEYEHFSLAPSVHAGELTFDTISAADAAELHALELRCFPTADPAHLLTEAGVHAQAANFPEGAFVVRDGDRVVGYGLGCFVDFDLDKPQHDIDEVVGHNGSDKHNPNGRWYYGTSIAVDPKYRGRGIGRHLYDLRKDVARRYNRAGIVAGGMIPGYAEYKDSMSAADYVKAVAAGELNDPTLSMQIANGFEVAGVVADYIADETTEGWASLIVWHNPEYDPGAGPR